MMTEGEAMLAWFDADARYRRDRDRHLIERMAKEIGSLLALPPWDMQDARTRDMALTIARRAIKEVREAQRAYPDAFADF
jgi:hypothetical protein